MDSRFQIRIYHIIEESRIEEKLDSGTNTHSMYCRPKNSMVAHTLHRHSTLYVGRSLCRNIDGELHLFDNGDDTIKLRISATNFSFNLPNKCILNVITRKEKVRLWKAANTHIGVIAPPTNRWRTMSLSHNTISSGENFFTERKMSQEGFNSFKSSLSTVWSKAPAWFKNNISYHAGHNKIQHTSLSRLKSSAIMSNVSKSSK